MGEQVAQLQHGVIEVVAKHRFAQMLDENAANRAAAIEHAAVMTRAGPEHIALLRIVHQRTKERRFQALRVLPQARDQILGDKVRRFFGEEHEAVDVVEHFYRDVFQTMAAAHQHDHRHIEAPFAGKRNQLRRLALQPFAAPVHDQAADGGVGAHHQLGVVITPRS